MMAEKNKSYFIENTVGRPGTRLHRAKSPMRQRATIFIAGQRLLTGKKIAMTEEQFEGMKAQLYQMVLEGRVSIHQPDGTRITSLHTGQFILTRKDGATKQVDSLKGVSIPKPPNVEIPPPPTAPPVPEPVVDWVEPPSVDEKLQQDLTELPNIGSGRAKKMVARGVSNYHQVIKLGVAGLVDMLGLTEEVAQEIMDKATELSKR
jgi:hypothetical protein